MSGSDDAATPSLTLTRTIAAPRALLFDLWTKREHLVHWFMPRDFTSVSCEIDARVGGAYRVCFRSPKGEVHCMKGVFREIVPSERLSMTFAWEHEDAPENRITVTFRDVGEQTEITFLQAPFPSAAERDSHADGWGEALDNLVAYVPRAAGGAR